ncbi:MAG: 4Fe-4S binding protein, partial [Anaerovoracaceae bacterium]
MKQWKNRHRIIRAIIQIGFFLLYSGAWAAAFGGVRYILGQIHLVEPIEFNGLVKTLAVLVLMTIIMGRFFCGYACAFGTLGDGVYGLSCWIQKNVLKRKKPFSFSKKTIIISQKIKYVLLAGILIFCFLGKYDLISSLDP